MATIHVTGKDSAVSSTNRAHAEEKLSRLAKYFNGIERIEAVLDRAGDEASVEVVISISRGNPIVCRSQAKDLYAAIDLVLDKAETHLTRHKERVRQRKTARREVGAEFVEAPEEADALRAEEADGDEEGRPEG